MNYDGFSCRVGGTSKRLGDFLRSQGDLSVSLLRKRRDQAGLKVYPAAYAQELRILKRRARKMPGAYPAFVHLYRRIREPGSGFAPKWRSGGRS